ncbi:MAG: HAMP domain-containing histidine kinase [Deltaproteobacteria bacterium]|nr:HAMP domain-containing histidine kinase [Deltaproteobacteria bacterium]
MHRRIFFSFGCVILFTVLEIALINHFLGMSVVGRPWRALLLFGVPTLLLWTASGRVARRMSRPLYELTRVADKIGAGDLSARAPTGWMPSGEVAVLSRAINDMAGRIAHQMAEQRELLAAVSHELRTPLARIRLLVEIAREREQQSSAADNGGALGPKTLDEIERETVEIDTLVGELLASARLEFQALSPRPLDAVEIAQRAIERAGLGADKLSVPASASPCRFDGDPTLVARALANLIDNARKHAGGLDRLSVKRVGEFIVFEVADRGPGFAPGDETRIFASFTRGRDVAEDERASSADDSEAAGRSQSDSRGGSHSSLGLGLSLVKRIAQAHGGDVTAKNRVGGGATLTLRFAITPPDSGPRE